MVDEHDSVHDAKAVAFYSTVVQAWVATRMEKDRTLLGLAGGGVGLLATLLTTVGPSSSTELLLYGLAGLSFVCAILVALLVLDRNSHHLEEVIRSGKTDDDHRLIMLDRFLLGFFLVGVMLTGVLGMVSGYNGSSWRDAPMAQDKQMMPRVTGAPEVRSVTGIGSLAPQPASSQSAGTSASPGSGPVAEEQAATEDVSEATETLKE